jgi:hypothetical protein
MAVGVLGWRNGGLTDGRMTNSREALLMLFSGAWGKTIHEKPESKNS